MKRIAALLIAVLLLLFTACNGRPRPLCGNSVPRRPTTARAPSFFGRVITDQHGWTVQRDGRTEARLDVGGHHFAVNAQTERLNRCGFGSDPTRCAAFVGLWRPGVAAWILFATPQRRVIQAEDGKFETREVLEVGGVMVWRVRPTTILLSQGVALRITHAFAHELKQVEGIPGGLRDQLEGPQLRTGLYVDPRTGDVFDALPQIAGCA